MGTEAIWVAAVLLGLAAVLALLVLTTPPRCAACGVSASAVDEYEVSPTPHLLAVTYRCPRCGQVVVRRVVGVPDQ